MQKIVMFFVGILMLGASFGALYLTGGIYDAATQIQIRPYFFQPNNSSSMRIGVPLSPREIGAGAMRDLMIKKFVNEYLYVMPDTQNMNIRKSQRGELRRMSSMDVFEKWLTTVGEQISDMTEQKMLRVVRVTDEIIKPDGSDYWIVSYEMRTWVRPNDMSTAPIVERGQMGVRLHPDTDATITNPNIINAGGLGKYLTGGGAPSGIFKFMVTDVQM